MISSLIFLTATSQCLPAWVRWWRPGWWVKHTLAPVGAVGQVGRTNLEALHLLLCGLGGVGVVGAFGRHAVEYGSSIRMQACGKKRRVATGRGERNFGLAAAIDKRPVAVSPSSSSSFRSFVHGGDSCDACSAFGGCSAAAQRLLSGRSPRQGATCRRVTSLAVWPALSCPLAVARPGLMRAPTQSEQSAGQDDEP
jgi:hypothetical protein